jgi:hypothetical protein
MVTLEECEEIADLWLIMKDVSADDRIDAYQQSEQNWALGPTTPLMSADGEDAESELTLRGALAPQDELIHANELKRNWINAWIALAAGEEEEMQMPREKMN